MLQRFSILFFFPSSCCGKSLRRCHFIYIYFHKEKRKRRNMRHASLNTRCATRIVEYNTRYLAKAQQRAEREGAGKVRRAQQALSRWVKGNREGKRGGGRGAGEKRRRVAGAPLTLPRRSSGRLFREERRNRQDRASTASSATVG